MSARLRAGISLDDAPFRPLHLLAAACTLGGAFLDGYIIGIIGKALGPAATELRLDSLGTGLIAASALVGIFVGGLVFGRVADRYGRRRVFLWNLLAFVLLSCTQLFVQDAVGLIAVRTLLGLAIGVEYAVGAAMLAEFLPRRLRGPVLGGINAMWMVGFVAAFLLSAALTDTPWRILLATSAVPAIAVVLLRTRLPESPRWLAVHGRGDEAQALLDHHLGPGYVVPTSPDDDTDPGTFRELFAPGQWRSTLYAGLFWFAQVAPFFSIFTFLGPVLAGLGLEEGFSTDLLIDALQLVGVGVGLYFLRLMPRRPFIITGFAVTLVTLVILGAWPGGPATLLLTVFCAFTVITAGSSNVSFVYPSEIFSTRLRGTGVGFAAAFSRIGAATATYLLPVTLEAWGSAGTLLVAAVFPLMGLVASIAWAPETRDSALR